MTLKEIFDKWWLNVDEGARYASGEKVDDQTKLLSKTSFITCAIWVLHLLTEASKNGNGNVQSVANSIHEEAEDWLNQYSELIKNDSQDIQHLL